MLRQSIQRVPSDHEFSNPVALMAIKVVKYTAEEVGAGKVLDIPIDKDTCLLGVGHKVTEVFTVAGGDTLALNIGDGSSANKFMASASLTLGTLNDFHVSLLVANSKFYAAPGVVRLTFTDVLTDGEGEVHLFFYQTKGNWRQSDLG